MAALGWLLNLGFAGSGTLAVSCAVTGTVVSAPPTEADIVAGGKTIILTLTDDTWDANVGADDPATTALINGLDSDAAEATGWDAVVKAGLTFANVTRDSNVQVTILLPAFPTYDITANETITATIPAAAVAGSNPITATPDFTVSFVADSVDTGAGGGGRKKRPYGKIWSVEEWLAQFDRTEPKAKPPALPRKPRQPDLLPEHVARLEEVRVKLAQQRVQTDGVLRTIKQIDSRLEKLREDDEAVEEAVLLLLTMLE